MKLHRVAAFLIAVFLAFSIFLGTHPPTASASTVPCPQLIPSGNYPSGFGSTLGTFSSNGYLIYVCNNGYNGYFSNVSTGAGIAFQCVELANRFAQEVYGTDPNYWRGNADTHWTTTVPGWYEEPNGGNYLPRAGDLIVWGPPAHDDSHPGHIAVIASTTRVNTTTWNVTAANENFSNNGMTAWSYGTITRTYGDGVYWYDLSMQQGVAYSVLYGVMHY